MTLPYIAAFALAACIYGVAVPARWRGWTLLLISLIAPYALQPLLTIRTLGFLLPTLTPLLTVACWGLTRPRNAVMGRDDRVALLLIVLVVAVLPLTRGLAPALRPQNPTPDVIPVVAGLIVAAALGLLLSRVATLQRDGLRWAMIGLILLLFVVLKTDPLAQQVAVWMRLQTGQSPELAGAVDLQWLGFSYVAFRLIHTLRDRQTERLPALSLPEYATYVLFFPSLTAGPIDRAEHFAPQVRALDTMPGLDASRYTVGAARIVIGLFKKFVIADSLALFALNATNAAQATSSGALWLLLYAYAFRLLFDFSGYTDIAIGIGLLFGIRLPENFDRPYLRQNLALFWQSWHITLGNWARFYVFTPLSRALLKRKPRPSPLMVVLIAQVATMLTIGLWHGVAWTFVLWALWHGLGLFVHKAWSDRTRPLYLRVQQRPRLRRVWTVAGIALTFHFVVLGWVWFAVPDVQLAAATWARLLGMSR